MKTLKIVSISLVVVLTLALAGAFFVNSFQNHAISLEEQVKTATSDIDVQQKRRVDLIQNLVDCVKQYDKHESETLKSVVEGRSAKDIDIKEVNTLLTATAEAYPQLKSNEQYKQLMTELSTTENLIAQVRNNYNQQVKSYNTYVKGFPRKQFLLMTGYEVVEYKALEFNAPVDSPKNLFGDK